MGLDRSPAAESRRHETYRKALARAALALSRLTAEGVAGALGEAGIPTAALLRVAIRAERRAGVGASPRAQEPGRG